MRLLRLLRMMRLLLAQDALLPPDFFTEAPFRIRFACRLFTLGAKRFREDQRGQELSDKIRKLGPTYIKLGQFLATRSDIIGLAMAQDLRHLQDRLPPFSDKQVARLLATELDNADAIIKDMGPPIAAASIAQVHVATHRETGQKLAVKFLRPGVEDRLRGELELLARMAKWAERFFPITHRLRPLDAITTLARSINGETDFRMEAAALSEMAENTAQDKGFCVPDIIWEASGRRVLTMSWVDGVSASDIEGLQKHGHDLSDLATRLLQIFLTLVLRDGFFHADMHQGNLLVQKDGTIVAIDLGICGRLDKDSRRFLAEILHGFITRDYVKLAQVHIEAGYVPDHHDVHEFAQALRSVGEPIRDRDADDVSMGRVLSQLFAITEQFDMATQPQLLLLQKTMVTVEGVARSFDPKINIWDASETLVADWLRRQIGPEAILRDMRDNAGSTLRALRRLPETLAQAERGAAALETMAHLGAGQTAPVKTDALARGLGLAALAAAAGALAVALTGIF
ncbi:MAG: 2-polyprenylphenol 6-hydroxylase [Alphaproteobacteria bacterium]|nr:2-polyprenylphenol 6-hydroxylase [Alphaproteobacteria bacterium]